MGCVTQLPKPASLAWHTVYRPIDDAKALNFLESGIQPLTKTHDSPEIPIKEVMLRHTVKMTQRPIIGYRRAFPKRNWLTVSVEFFVSIWLCLLQMSDFITYWATKSVISCVQRLWVPPMKNAFAMNSRGNFAPRKTGHGANVVKLVIGCLKSRPSGRMASIYLGGSYPQCRGVENQFLAFPSAIPKKVSWFTRHCKIEFVVFHQSMIS